MVFSASIQTKEVLDVIRNQDFIWEYFFILIERLQKLDLGLSDNVYVIHN